MPAPMPSGTAVAPYCFRFREVVVVVVAAVVRVVDVAADDGLVLE